MSAFVAAPVASPCTGVCRIDAQVGWCEGCRRTLDEIAVWSTLDEAARQRVCDALPLRRWPATSAGGTTAESSLPSHPPQFSPQPPERP